MEKQTKRALQREACLDCPVSALCIAGMLRNNNSVSKVFLPGGREVLEMVWYSGPRGPGAKERGHRHEAHIPRLCPRLTIRKRSTREAYTKSIKFDSESLSKMTPSERHKEIKRKTRLLDDTETFFFD